MNGEGGRREGKRGKEGNDFYDMISLIAVWRGVLAGKGWIGLGWAGFSGIERKVGMDKGYGVESHATQKSLVSPARAWDRLRNMRTRTTYRLGLLTIQGGCSIRC